MKAFTLESLEAERAARLHAWQTVRRAKKSGQLVPPERCEKCGHQGKLECHHADYTLPLDVQWLCLGCHRAVHRAARHHYKHVELETIARNSMPDIGDSTPGADMTPDLTPGAAYG